MSTCEGKRKENSAAFSLVMCTPWPRFHCKVRATELERYKMSCSLQLTFGKKKFLLGFIHKGRRLRT